MLDALRVLVVFPIASEFLCLPLQLAWWTAGFYATVYWMVAGGSGKKAAKQTV
jgi:hypothetical protein